MLHYFLKKLCILFLSLVVVATLTFFLMHAIPGDPFTQEKAIPEEILKAMQKHYGLDKPLIIQYFEYMQGLCHLDLGPSFKYQGRTVNEIIQEGFPVSLCLGMEALFLSLSFGTLLGSLSASKQGKWQDRSTMFLAILGLSVPSFLLATFLQYLLAMKFDLFPVARWGTFHQSILPALSLSALPTAFIARLLRASMIEVLHQDYIQTAKSKGLSTTCILYKHVLRNALLPVASYLGPLTASILTGSFAVEKIFGIPGLGQWFVLSITNRDYTVIMGTTLFYSVILMISVFLVDLFYSWIDPRIQNPIKRGAL
ncbi:MAG: ABC transporter permease [Rhabdochlamydiaceae bacterium]|nr:ABC transporter permease [Rhabdochlamydiaceae bacterium]